MPQRTSDSKQTPQTGKPHTYTRTAHIPTSPSDAPKYCRRTHRAAGCAAVLLGLEADLETRPPPRRIALLQHPLPQLLARLQRRLVVLVPHLPQRERGQSTPPGSLHVARDLQIVTAGRARLAPARRTTGTESTNNTGVMFAVPTQDPHPVRLRLVTWGLSRIAPVIFVRVFHLKS
jgi:hypothetical protein